MNENYYSGDVGKCPFATAAHARKLANDKVSVEALKKFTDLVFIAGPVNLVVTALALALVGTAVAVFFTI